MQTPSSPPPASASTRILEILRGAWISQAVSVAATLGVADALSAGPRPVEEVAAAVDATPDSLYRLLRALSDVGVLEELPGRRFALTELGGPLRNDVPDSMRAWAMLVGSPAWRGMWTELLHSVRTGEPAFERVHGRPLFDYLPAHPELATAFDAGMTALSRRWITAIVDAYDFSGLKTVVDVGGGNGALLAAVLTANPSVRGVLFDLPETVAGARRLLEDAGVGDRAQCVAGDFFAAVPAGGDVYLLTSIVHDWDDVRAVRILTCCRAAMADGSRLLLGEMVLPSGLEPSFAKLLDLEMLLIGGRQRTEPEFADLLRQAGLRLTRVIPASNQVLSILEAVPA